MDINAPEIAIFSVGAKICLKYLGVGDFEIGAGA